MEKILTGLTLVAIFVLALLTFSCTSAPTQEKVEFEKKILELDSKIEELLHQIEELRQQDEALVMVSNHTEKVLRDHSDRLNVAERDMYIRLAYEQRLFERTIVLARSVRIIDEELSRNHIHSGVRAYVAPLKGDDSFNKALLGSSK